jgi:hypothetical protein
MTKARSKAARRRRANLISLPGGEQINSAPVHIPRAGRKAEPPADAVALAHRAKFTGCTVEEARDVLASSDMGRCIRFLARDQAKKPREASRADLLTVWQGISAAKQNWQQRITSSNPNPQAAAIAMLPETMQTDTGHSVDLRTADERDNAARRVWYHWLALLMELPPGERHALRGHLDGYEAPIWCADNHAPTHTGALAVKALAKLHLAQRS